MERRRKGGVVDFNMGRTKSLKLVLIELVLDLTSFRDGTVLPKPISLDRRFGQTPFASNCTALRSFCVSVRLTALT